MNNHHPLACRFLSSSILLIAMTLTLVAAPERLIDVTKSGVVGDGITLNTAAIQKVIDDCSATGGGIIDFPAGNYLTGTIQIKSNVTLRIEDQATLLGSTNAADYRNLDPFIDGSGNSMGYALIVALDAAHVSLEGKGTVNGQSPALKATQKKYTVRPFLVRWIRCTDVTMSDLHLINPGAWTLNFFQTKGAAVNGVTIRSRDLKMANNDGIDLDSCENIRIRNCDINSGDDALCIKATSLSQPSRDIEAINCKLSTQCNAIKLGTEAIGGFENITVSNCQITNTRMSGIVLNAVDGGDLRKVTISDVTMDGVMVPIVIRLGSRLKAFREGEQPRLTPGKLRDVLIKNVTAKNIGLIGILINGIPGYPVEAVTLDTINLKLPGGGTAQDAKKELPEKEKSYPEYSMFGKTLPAYGLYARHVHGLTLHDVSLDAIAPDARPSTVFVDVEDVTPADFAGGTSKSQ